MFLTQLAQVVVKVGEVVLGATKPNERRIYDDLGQDYINSAWRFNEAPPSQATRLSWLSTYDFNDLSRLYVLSDLILF